MERWVYDSDSGRPGRRRGLFVWLLDAAFAVVTALVALLGWVLFRADNLGMALQYAGNLFSLEGVWISEVLTVQSGAALLAGH